MNNQTERFKIAIIAYACEPNSASEPYLSWETISSLANFQDFSISIITRSNNIHSLTPGCPNNISLHGVDLPWPMTSLKRRLKVISTQLYALLWQYAAARIVRNLHRSCPFDLVHGLSFMSVYNFSAGLANVPSLIGPIGGAQRIPPALKQHGGWEEYLRNISLCLLPYIPGWKSSMRSSRIISANHETKEYLCSHAGISPEDIIVRQPGLPGMRNFVAPPAIKPNNTIKLFWGSRGERWKGLGVLLEGLATAISAGVNCRLDIAGPQTLRPAWSKELKRLKIDRHVTIHGEVTRSQLEALRSNSDILCFTSLRETTGLALMEMLETGKPTMVIECGGPREIIKSVPCIRIRPDHAVDDISTALRQYSLVPNAFSQQSRIGGAIFRDAFSWESYIAFIADLYRSCILKSRCSDRAIEQ